MSLVPDFVHYGGQLLVSLICMSNMGRVTQDSFTPCLGNMIDHICQTGRSLKGTFGQLR